MRELRRGDSRRDVLLWKSQEVGSHTTAACPLLKAHLVGVSTGSRQSFLKLFD